MKTRLFLILLFISSFTFGQWSTVGSPQFTTNPSFNGELTFNNSGTPFVVYEHPAGNGIYVMKFDGTNWVDVGSGAISTENYNNLAIKVNPVTNEPWVVLKSASSGSASNLDIFSFDGSTWVSQGQNVGGSIYSYGIQLQFNASGDPRIAAIVYGNGGGSSYRRPIFYNLSSSTWTSQYGPSTSSIASFGYQTRIDFYDYSHFLWADTNGNIRKYTIPGTMDANFANTTNGSYQYRNISGITGTNYFASNKINTNSIYFGNGTIVRTQPVGADAVTNGIIKLRESTTDNKYYLMFEETDNSIIFQKYNTALNTWSILPNIGLFTTTTDFFIKMQMNPVDGNMYVLYKDGGKISVKKLNIHTPLNLARIYVDKNATGNADGSSWADAFTDLQAALSDVYANTAEVWVAQGVYEPSVSDKNSSFTLVNSISYYGGFDGTETQISQRDLLNNNTILSGDLSGDDTGVNWNASNRSDNSYHVVKVVSDNVLLDGFTIQDGQANAFTGSNSEAGGIHKVGSLTNFIIKNCTIKNNVGFTSGGMYLPYNNGGNLTIENCHFESNLSRYGAGFLVTLGSNKTANVKVSNSLFVNNMTRNAGAGTSRGYAGSAFWIRANGSSSTMDATIRNCTFSLNSDNGSHPAVAQRSTVGLSKEASATFNAEVSNCILYANTQTSGAAWAIGSMHANAPNYAEVNNSIGQFSNQTYVFNSINSDPLFTDSANGDFTLQSGSPAIDSGDNSKIPVGTLADLLGNDRIYNTAVDMGCYEYGASPVVTVNDIETLLSFTLYPNPVKDILHIKMNNNLSHVVIYNLQGQKVIESNKELLNISQLSTGFYLIKVETTEGNIATKRFIKK